MFDVRVSKHYAKTKDANYVVITFAQGLENLVGTKYVILWVNDGHLYFKPSTEKVKGALKLNKSINAWSQYDKLVKFEGEYSLEYDNFREMYYIDYDKKVETSYMYLNGNVPHPNYKAHVNEPYVVKDAPIIIDVPNRKYSMVVYDGLLELLRVQIQDLNKSAVNATDRKSVV